MINKFIAVESIGSFDSFKAKGQTSFTRLSLVFGENGAGKTTLVSILRSWKDDSAALLEERRTLGAAKPQLVQLLESGASCTYSNGKWQRGCPSLEIFDETYVEESVYGEAGIGVGNRRSLYQIVLGKTGNELRKLQVDIENKSRTITKVIGECERALEETCRPFSLEAFLRLDQPSGIDDAISQAEAHLKAVYQSKQIRTHSLPEAPRVQPFDTNALRTFLSTSLSTVASNAADRVQDHAEHRLGGNDGAQWLATGARYGIEHDCPFCKLSTAGNPLIEAYKGYFSEAYTEFEHETREQAKSILESIDLTTVQRVVGAIKVALENVEWWKQHLDIAPLEFDTESLLSAAVAAQKALQNLVKGKMDSVLTPVTMDSSDVELLEQFNDQVEAVSKFAGRIDKIRMVAELFQIEIGQSSEVEAKQELLRLEATRRRFSDPCSRMCIRLQTARRIKTKLADRKQLARESLESYSTDLLQKYQEGINAHLRRFGASYRIGPMTEAHAGGQPSCKFAIELRETFVPTDTAPKVGHVRFKTLLSSGDKRTLALALFLASLDSSQHLADTIILFDDPMTSLDQARELQTIRQCIDLAQQCRQVLVLSHDPLFLREVWDGRSSTSTATLRIRLRGLSSEIEQWDIESETAPKFYTQLDAITTFVEQGAGDPLAIKRMLRPLLETWLRHRRPSHFGPTVWLGSMIEAIRAASPGTSLAKLAPHLKDISEINDYTKGEHHGSNPGASATTINTTQLKTYAQLTLDLVTES